MSAGQKVGEWEAAQSAVNRHLFAVIPYLLQGVQGVEYTVSDHSRAVANPRTSQRSLQLRNAGLGGRAGGRFPIRTGGFPIRTGRFPFGAGRFPFGGRLDIGPMWDVPARRRIAEAKQLAVHAHVQAQHFAADRPRALRQLPR